MRVWNSTLKAGKPLQSRSQLARSAFKRRAPKRRTGQNKAYLEACRGQRCYLQVEGVCLGLAGLETVVPCHSNQNRHGKGMGIKAHDKYTVPGCMTCHSWLDQGSAPKQIKFEYWNRAYDRWAAVRDQNQQAKNNPATAETVPGDIQQKGDY